MIPRNLSGLAVSVLCTIAVSAVAQSPSATAGTWEIEKLAFEVPTAAYSPRPDGGLATVTFGTVTASDILVIDSRHSRPHKLVTGAFPAWSPDGTQLAYCTREGIGFGQIQIVDADGRNKKQLTKIKGGACYPDWSPDGKRILFTAFDSKNSDIFVMDRDGQNMARVTEGYAAHWSPDGNKLLFTRSPEKGDNQQSVWVATVDGKDTRLAVRGVSLQDATWLPNGAGIVFSSFGGKNQTIFLSNLNGAQPREIEDDNHYEWFEPMISPDGKYLVAVVKCIRDSCSSGSSLQPFNSTSILLVEAGTHRQKVLAQGTHPSVSWSNK